MLKEVSQLGGFVVVLPMLDQSVISERHYVGKSPLALKMGMKARRHLCGAGGAGHARLARGVGSRQLGSRQLDLHVGDPGLQAGVAQPLLRELRLGGGKHDQHLSHAGVLRSHAT